MILEGGADESLVSRRIILASGEQRRQGSIFWSAVASVLAVLSVVWVLVAVNAIRSIQRKNPDPYQQYRKLNSSAWVLIGLAVFGLISLPFVIWIVRHYRGRFRRMPRTSVKNGKPMRLLDEEQDDAFLNAGQLCEETIRSVDYDVWVTEERDDIMVLRYDRWSGKYKACNSCSYRTEYKSSSHVITPATYSSSGLAEDRFTCMHCGHTRTATHVIPRKRRSSSSSGSSHGSSGSRSFGGGRSGGGGAGGKW